MAPSRQKWKKSSFQEGHLEAFTLCVMFNVLNNRPHRKVADIIGCY